MKKILLVFAFYMIACNLYFMNTVTYATYVPDALYNMDFDSYSSADSPLAIRKAENDLKSGVKIDENYSHYYTFYGPNEESSFNYLDLLFYNIHSNEFTDNAVFQADYRIPSDNASAISIEFRDINAVSEFVFSIGEDGYIYNKTLNIKVSEEINCKDNWVNIAVLIDFKNKKYDIYLNGEESCSDIPFAEKKLCSNIYYIRYSYKGSYIGNDSLDIDNIWAYKSSEYIEARYLCGVGGEWKQEKEEWTHEIDKTQISPNFNRFERVIETPMASYTPRLTDFKECKNAYRDAICFVKDNKNLWIKDGKYKSEHLTLSDNGEIIAATPVLSALLNVSEIASGNTVQIGNVSATVGDRFIYVGSNKIETRVPVQIHNGQVYIPLREFAIYGMKKWYGNSFLGFSVIANEERDIHYKTDTSRPNLYTVSNTSQMMAYLIMDLPNQGVIINTFNSASKEKRPYIVYSNEEFEKLKDLADNDLLVGKYSNTVLSTAENIYYTSYTVNDVAGSLVSPVFTSKEPWVLYWAYQITGNKKYVNKAEELALKMCNLSHWSSSFHFLQTSQALLGASYFYDLFYDDFSDATKKIIANAIINKGLRPAKEYYEGSKEGIHNDWCIRNSNWNCISNTGVIVAASTLFGEGYDDALMAESIERAFVSLGYFMQYFAPNGGGAEGIGYTSFILSYICEAVDVLERCFGTDFGLSNYPGFWDAGYFIPNATLGQYSFILNEDEPGGEHNPITSLWFAKKTNDATLADYVYSYFDKYGETKVAYAATLFKNAFAYNKEDVGKMPIDSLYTGAEIGFSQDGLGDKGTFLGVHGGHNHVAGGAYDYGSFQFEAFGLKFATGIGHDNLSLPGISNFAYNHNYYSIRSEGHNVYVINPDEKPGQNRYTYGAVKVQDKSDKGIIYILDMMPAYSSYVKAAQRGYMLTNDRKVFVLQDEIVPKSDSQDEFYWFWHTDAEIEIDSVNNIVELTKQNKKVKLYFDCSESIQISSGKIAPLPSSPNPEGQLLSDAHQNMQKITVRFKSNREPITFRVIAEPVGQEYYRGALTPISSWTIDKGEINDNTYSKADEIKVAGERIPCFNSNCYDYTVYYSTEDDLPPTVSAEASNANISIKQAAFNKDTAIVKIENKKNPGNFKIYTITLISRRDSLGETETLVKSDFENQNNISSRPSSSNFFVYHNGGGTLKIEKDLQRNTNVLNCTVKSATETGRSFDVDALVHLDHNFSANNAISTSGGLVCEFSFKLDKKAKLLTQISDVIVWQCDRDGKIYIIEDNSSKYEIGSYNLNEWYNVKIVYDNVNKYWNQYARVYVYINDEYYVHTTNSFASDTYSATLINHMPRYSNSAMRFSMYANQSEAVNFYIDDVFLYTTEKAPYGKIDVSSDLLGTNLLSNRYKITENNITIPYNSMVSDVLKNIYADGNAYITVYKNNVPVEKECYKTTSAIECKIFVAGNSRKIILPYEFDLGEEGFRVLWEIKKSENKEVVSDISQIKKDDVLYISANIINETDFDKSGIVIFALYDDSFEKLVKENFVAPKKNLSTINMSEVIKIDEIQNKISLKGFLWDNLNSLEPLIGNWQMK